MTQPLSALHLTGADILRDGKITRGEIAICDGLLSDDSAGPMADLSGYLVLPGVIDLHGDAFEHHIAPRPSAPFPLEMALVGTDRDAAAHGITTAWMAQSWSWEGGQRSPDYARALLEAHRLYRPKMMTDLRVQLRVETHTMDSRDALIDAVAIYGVDYVIFNNHLNEALAMAQTQPERIAAWAARAGQSVADFMAVIDAAKARGREVPRYLCTLAHEFDRLGVKFGSHDDPDAETRERFSMIGARVCEFPTGKSAAAAAKSWDDPVLMGAPNVVRGGSQSGNIAAMALIRAGLCTALVSDYHYPTLHKAAFRLADAGVMDLAAAWAMISTAPAQIMGLADRGTIAPGKRADLTVINQDTRMIEGTLAGGRWSYLAGDLAQRLLCTRGPRLSLAAE